MKHSSELAVRHVETTFRDRVRSETGRELRPSAIGTIQVNVGFRCNQACAHCHVEASPERSESMDWPVMELVLDAADRVRPAFVDVTGGAPELNPHFRRFVAELRKRGHAVQVRTNLSVFSEARDLPEFLKDRRVRLVASLPCYLEENVRDQRGAGVYEKSIEAIRRLNELGYGLEEGLPLRLVYNPMGAFLPPSQPSLEEDYRRELGSRFGIAFTNLLTITNMPIGRFRQKLRKEEKEEEYRRLLVDSFNPATVRGLMCLSQVCVGWDGRLYDCDFNLVLGLGVKCEKSDRIGRFDPAELERRPIAVGSHCFACTAGSGSSCGGALV